MAAALAWRLGIDGFDESWAEPLPETVAARSRRERLTRDMDWALHYLAPWGARASVASLRGSASSASAGPDDRPESWERVD